VGSVRQNIAESTIILANFEL